MKTAAAEPLKARRVTSEMSMLRMSSRNFTFLRRVLFSPLRSISRKLIDLPRRGREEIFSFSLPRRLAGDASKRAQGRRTLAENRRARERLSVSDTSAHIPLRREKRKCALQEERKKRRIKKKNKARAEKRGEQVSTKYTKERARVRRWGT